MAKSTRGVKRTVIKVGQQSGTYYLQTDRVKFMPGSGIDLRLLCSADAEDRVHLLRSTVLSVRQWFLAEIE